MAGWEWAVNHILQSMINIDKKKMTEIYINNDQKKREIMTKI